jgi:hypothetical protein
MKGIGIKKIKTATRRQLIREYKEVYAMTSNYYYDCVYYYLEAIGKQIEKTGGFPRSFFIDGRFKVPSVR